MRNGQRQRNGRVAPDGEEVAAPQLDAQAVSLPSVYVYERTVAGLGFSARLFELHETLLDAAADLIAACPCPHGCPACVGPILEHEQAYLETKSLTTALLHVLRTGARA